MKMSAHAGAWWWVPGLLIATLSCGDVALGIRSLEISPNPAQPGDSVSFFFWLTVVPEQDYTVIAFIDSTEQVTQDAMEGVDGPVVLPVGAADDLITRFGLGTHTAYVEVRLKGQSRTARTADRSFELQAAAQPAGRGKGNP
jgi:hypothetical protein